MADSTPIASIAAIVTAAVPLVMAGIRAWSWRHYERLKMRHAELMVQAEPESRAILAQLAPLPPPKIGPLAVLFLGGSLLALGAASARGELNLASLQPAERCRPACERGQRCIGTICTMEAHPAPQPVRQQDTATSQATPEKPQFPPPPRRTPGPQSALDSLAAQRWTDGSDYPYETECGQ